MQMLPVRIAIKTVNSKDWILPAPRVMRIRVSTLAHSEQIVRHVIILPTGTTQNLMYRIHSLLLMRVEVVLAMGEHPAVSAILPLFFRLLARRVTRATILKTARAVATIDAEE